MEFRKIDKIALRKIKDSGNYNSFVKLKHLIIRHFNKNGVYLLYNAVVEPENYNIVISGKEMPFRLFLEKNNLVFSFFKK